MKKLIILSSATILLAACLFQFEFVEKPIALAVTNDAPAAENTAPVTDSSETVELRLTVVDESGKAVPEALAQLNVPTDTVNEAVILDLGQTDSNGKLLTKISASMVFPDTSINFYQRNGGLMGSHSLRGISETWKSPQSLEREIRMFKARRMSGVVVDSNDKPVASAVVCANFCGPMQKTLTDENGHFELDTFPHQPSESLYAFKVGVGAGMISPDFPLEEAWKATGEQIHWEQWQKNHSDGPFTIKIERGKTISVKVVDPEGNPLEGILTYPGYFSADNSFWNTWDFGMLFPQRTDKNGMITFDWIPTSNYHIITFRASGTDPRFDKESKINQYGESQAVWRESADNNDLVIQLPKKIMVEGSVKKADGVTPISPGMQISVTGGTGWASVGTQTDYAGNFAFFVNANEVVSVLPICNQGSTWDANAAIKAMLNVPVGNGWTPVPRFDFVLEEGTLVKGKITSVESREDYSKLYVQIHDDTANNGQLTEMNRLYVVIDLNQKGEFETRLPDGRYRFNVSEYKDGKRTEKDIDKPLIINGETEIQFDMDI